MGKLELREEGSTLRHYVGGEAVHDGDMLEVRMPGGSWMSGRYLWRSKEERQPRLYVSREVWLWVTDNDVLRWPEADA